MKFNTFCIVSGTENCTAGCAWCVASMTPDLGVGRGKVKPIDQKTFEMACRLAKQSDLDTARLTGKGEPTIYPGQITEYLKLLQPHGFSFVELQTHGGHLAKEDRVSLDDMRTWADLGLTHVCISIISYKRSRNGQHYFSKNKAHRDYFDMGELIEKLHGLRLNVRLTCIMQRGDIDSADELDRLMKWSKKVKADQVTILPVNKPEDSTRNPRVYDAAVRAMLTNAQLKDIRAYASRGELLRTLPWGGQIYDLNGQNLCLNYCLTETPNSDDSRQLIFYPPGTIGYDWQYEGATLYRLPEAATPVELVQLGSTSS